MLKNLNGLLRLHFERRKWVLDYGKKDWYCGIKSLPLLSNITFLFPLHVGCPSKILKLLQDSLLPLSFHISSDDIYFKKVF